ncbi:TPA: hypothetical protein ACGSNV_003197 [Klebsiella pneumoniae]
MDGSLPWSIHDLRYGGNYTTVWPERHGWRGFVNSVCRYHGSPVHRGVKPDSSTTPHFSAKNNSSPKKPETMRIASLFSPIFRHTRRVLEGAAITVIARCMLWEKAVAALLRLYMTAYAVWMW